MNKSRYGWDFSACTRVFRDEIALLKRIAGIQEEARDAMTGREWVLFGRFQQEVERLSLEFQGLEAERERLLEALKALVPGAVREGENLPFYALAAGLPQEERMELAKLYRELRLEACKVKVSGESFVRYLREAKRTTSEFLETAFPRKKGTLYTRKGVMVPQDLRSMVINRSM